MPSEPPMKSKSWTAATTGTFSTVAGADQHGVAAGRSWRGRRGGGRCSGARRGISAGRAARRGAGSSPTRASSKKCSKRCFARHPHVVAGAGDDVVVRLEVAMEDHLAGLGTLDPEILRHLPLGEEVPDLRTDDVADPAHAKPVPYSAASARAARTPPASSATRSVTALTVPAVARPSRVERILRPRRPAPTRPRPRRRRGRWPRPAPRS